MAKLSSKTYVDFEKFEQVAKEFDGKLDRLEQAGNLKLMPKGRTDVRLYVAKQRKVARVHIAGYVPTERAGTTVFSEQRRMGSVFAEIDFGASEEDVLASFRAAIEQMLTSPPKTEKEVKQAKKERSQKAQGAPRASKSGSQEAAPAAEILDPEAKRKRLELIQAVAKAKGVEVSVKTVDELA